MACGEGRFAQSAHAPPVSDKSSVHIRLVIEDVILNRIIGIFKNDLTGHSGFGIDQNRRPEIGCYP